MNKSELYKLGYGFVLGDSLDVNTFDGQKKKGESWETGWGNDAITEDLIKSIKDRGFKTIKIPISWEDHVHYDSTCKTCECDAWWKTRCKEVVQMVLNQDMYCIINTQHDADWISCLSYESSDDFCKLLLNKFKSLWRTIANIFKDINSDKLIYESMNEIGYIDAKGRENYIELCNSFISEVRKADGNLDRLLLIEGIYADPETTLANFPIDKISDENYAIALHLYNPASFTLADNILDKISNRMTKKQIEESDGSVNYYFDGDYLGVHGNPDPYIDAYGGEVLVKNYDHDELSRVLEIFSEIKKKYSIEVAITEFGCSSFYRDKDHVYDWFKQVTTYCQEHKIPLMMWNNGNDAQCILRKDNMQDRKSIDIEKIIRYYNNIVFGEELPESFRSDSDKFTNQIDTDESLI